MNYLLKTKPKHNTSFRRGLGVILCILAVIFIVFSFRASFPFRVLGSLAEPFWKAGSLASSFAGSHFGYLQSQKSLIEENERLRNAVESLPLVEKERDLLQEENRFLKNLEPLGGEVARVLTSPAQSFYDIMLVELSPNSAVSAGDRVYGEHRTALGTVIDRTGSFARIELFSSNGRITPVRLASTGSELILTGKGGGDFMVVVPRAFPIHRGDTLLFPSLASEIVAQVVAIEDARTDSFSNVYAASPLNIFNLSWVRIVHE